MQAVLWDGKKQIEGILEFKDQHIEFLCIDFANTNLTLKIDYYSILKVRYHQLYLIVNGGIEIISDNGKGNVFVVDNPAELKRMIQARMNKTV